MWLIERGTDGLAGRRILLPEPLRQALMRWYIGSGSRADEEAGIMLVQQARIGGKWLACNCKGAKEPPAILTPAYLSEAETYYLRRLTSGRRSEHHGDCPFFREQATNRVTQVRRRDAPADPPSAFFSALRPAPEKLAQRLENGAIDDRTRHVPFPRLARLLWRLIDVAGLNVCQALRVESPPSIAREFKSLLSSTRAMEVAPGIELARVISAHPQSLRSGSVFAKLRAMENSWPSGHAPQAFLALFAHRIHGATLHVADGPPLTLANRIQSPSTFDNRMEGPYLVLILVGQYPDARDYAALRGYAQPIYSGRRFIPVESAFERDAIRSLLHVRNLLDRESVDLYFEKPLFDILTPNGPCRPNLLLEARSRRTGEHRQLVVDIHKDAMETASNIFERDHIGQIASVFMIREGDLEASHLAERLGTVLNL